MKCTTQDTNCGTTDHVSELPCFRPNVDIVRTESGMELIADIPGATDSTTDVTVERNLLKIHATAELPDLDGFSARRLESRLGHFERSFTIPNEIDVDSVTASVQDGVLRIRLPNRADQGPRRIAIG